MERFFGNCKVTLYASGTAALAQAIAHCASRASVKTPEIIVPAYGCPDLVAACMQACAYPRLVDLARSGWSYDLEALKSSLTTNTVAIVAVNLLGLGDGATELGRICKDRCISLIQDSAQHLPRESIGWPGEFVVLSFGRGKPLNLLYGGALISPLTDRDSVSVEPARYTVKAHLLNTRAAAFAFNTLTRPTIYRMFSALPGTGLGEVSYKPLINVAPLPDRARQRVAEAFELYRQKPSYRLDMWKDSIERWSDLGIVALRCPGAPFQAEPLRLSLLAPDRAARDALVNNLNRAGMGASCFYRTDLTRVSGIPEIVSCQGPFPNASALADKFFTLPSHELVTTDTVRATDQAVLAWHRSRKSSSAQS
jgi:hypothetical protein